MAARKAASVLPDPVGARSSVDRPATIGAHPFTCAGVGPEPGNEARNHRWPGAWNAASAGETGERAGDLLAFAALERAFGRAGTKGLYDRGCRVARGTAGLLLSSCP